jgi:choloylglycine hydrolase
MTTKYKKDPMNHLKKINNLWACLFLTTLFTLTHFSGQACTRVLYQTATGKFIVGRNMDWSDLTMASDFWIFPRGMSKDGGVGSGSIGWTSKYGSLIISIYEAATVDGINEKGLVGNVLYLAESDYGDSTTRNQSLLSVGAWLQYILDNYQTVEEVVNAMAEDPLTIVTTKLPNGVAASGHLALADPSGDSAILEYLEGKLKIHHGKHTTIMTNSPPFDQQLAIMAYWDIIGGNNFLPGTIHAADRFVRASYNLKSSPKFSDERSAVASVFSQMRSVGVPFGMSEPEHPNIASTLWRSIIDLQGKRYYFDSVINPSVIWVDLERLDFSPGVKVKKLELSKISDTGGEVSSRFQPAVPFRWITP